MHKRLLCRAVSVACAGMALSAPAQSFTLDTDSPDLAISWDTTLKYSTAWRVRGVNPAMR